MKYYIISKIELEGTDSLKYTDVGYTEDINIANEINEQYDATLGKFLGENRTKLELEEVSISTFFNESQKFDERCSPSKFHAVLEVGYGVLSGKTTPSVKTASVVPGTPYK